MSARGKDSSPNMAGSSPAQESLLLGNGQQLALLEVDEAGLPAEAYALAEQAGRFTGERIFSTNPKLYRAIVALLGRAVPYREISEICSVSVNTVCAVAQREGVPIETLRERIGRLSLDVASLTIEAIRDMLADPMVRAGLTLRDLSVAYGIASQNGQLFLGGATARIEVAEVAPGHADYLAYIRNVTATGSVAENPALKGAAQAKGDQALEVAASMPAGPSAEASK